MLVRVRLRRGGAGAMEIVAEKSIWNVAGMVDLGLRGNECSGAARHRGYQVGGSERGGYRQIGCDQDGDPTVLSVIDEDPVECAAGVAAWADQKVIARRVGLHRERRRGDRMTLASDHDERVAEEMRRFDRRRHRAQMRDRDIDRAPLQLLGGFELFNVVGGAESPWAPRMRTLRRAVQSARPRRTLPCRR